MSRALGQPASRVRHLEIDLLKAVGILAVVLIHSLRPPWDPSVPAFEIWLQNITRFAVPCFLIASGFLYATRDPVPSEVTLRRVRRIVVPYLIASVAAQVYRIYTGRPSVTGSVVTDLLFGGSFGPYYYVLHIFLLVWMTPLFARLAGRRPTAFGVLVAASIVVQLVIDEIGIFDLHFRWYIRNPLVWWCYFLLGFAVRLHHAEVVRFVSERRAAIVSALVLLVAALGYWIAVPPAFVSLRVATWASTYAIASLLFVLACGRETRAAWLAGLSDCSYAIYLFHLFFVFPLAPLFRVPGELSPAALLVPWLAGLGGSLAIVFAARLLLGERSRDWVGA